MDPSGSVVLVTGASSGFGKLGAEALARRGHTVFATMREPDARNAPVRDELRALAEDEGIDLHVLELDVNDDNSVEAAVGRALERAGRIDAAINNAGYAAIGLTEAYTPDQLRAILETNVIGVHRVNRAVLPEMRRRGEGLLIHVSSGAGRATVPALGIYCASKYALEALADAYRYELAPFGIESVLVEPGIYGTPIFEKLPEPDDRDRLEDWGRRAEFVERVRATFAGAVAAPDAPPPDEVAELFVELVEAPAGKRPFRTVLGGDLPQLLDPYNEMAEQLRAPVAEMFQVPELLGRRG